jgi:uncharacterized protein (TIGR02145 family)
MKTQNIYRLMLFVLISINLITCKKDDNILLPSVKTYSPLYISSTAATIGCIVESDGGSNQINCGIYISNLQNPETTGSKFQIGNDTGTFLGQITGFLPGSEYFVKAYADNEKGESLGDQVTFTTPATITDIDNNIYETVKIGNQQWMTENLKTTKYSNGDLIGTTTPATLDISNESSPKYQWVYDSFESNADIYGRLYTGYVVTDSRGLCPTGWHVPSDAELTALITGLGGESIAGSKLKEAGTTHWSSMDYEATNESLFSFLPAGNRENAGIFRDIGVGGFLWSSTVFDITNGWYFHVAGGTSQVGRIGAEKGAGFSVRCIKD